MVDFPPPPPPTRFQRCSQRNPQRTAAALPSRQPTSTRKAASPLPPQQRHPGDAAPAFRLDGVSMAANLVALADPQNGIADVGHRLPHPAAMPQLGCMARLCGGAVVAHPVGGNICGLGFRHLGLSMIISRSLSEKIGNANVLLSRSSRKMFNSSIASWRS